MNLTDDEKFTLLLAYVEHQMVLISELPILFEQIYQQNAVKENVKNEAAQIKTLSKKEWSKLIAPNGIVSLIDNRKYKVMKRHLTAHGYTPKTYREAFGLPVDFPMVAPSYALSRSEIAKQQGLGKIKVVAKPLKVKPKRTIKAVA